MAKAKRVRAVCYGPIAAGPHYESGWEDVWIQWKGKPGRRKYYSGPTLMSRDDCEADLIMDKQLQARHPECDWSQDIADGERVMAMLARQPYTIGHDGGADGTPSVYTAKTSINRREAEEMLRFLLREQYGVRGTIKFQWNKPEVFVTPVSFDPRKLEVMDEPQVIDAVDQNIGADERLYCLGVNTLGQPLHPMARGKMRVPNSAQPIEWSRDAAPEIRDRSRGETPAGGQ